MASKPANKMTLRILDPEVLKALNRVVEKDGRSKQWIVHTVLVRYLKSRGEL